jgi:hypothetical protein
VIDDVEQFVRGNAHAAQGMRPLSVIHKGWMT